MSNPNLSTAEIILAFIEKYLEEHKYPPSQREIAKGCFLSRSAVHANLKKLLKNGYLELTPNKARNIKLLPKKSEHMFNTK